MRNSKRLASLGFAATLLAGCANGIPTEKNMGYVWDKTVSACRVGGSPNDECVTKDLNRCKALVDYANPGRDESTYYGIVSTLTEVGGTALTYGVTGIGMKSVEAATGTIAGGGASTAIAYNVVLYRSAVEACMYSYGRDPKLTEQFFGNVAYTGKVESLDSVLHRADKVKK